MLWRTPFTYTHATETPHETLANGSDLRARLRAAPGGDGSDRRFLPLARADQFARQSVLEPQSRRQRQRRYQLLQPGPSADRDAEEHRLDQPGALSDGARRLRLRRSGYLDRHGRLFRLHRPGERRPEL